MRYVKMLLFGIVSFLIIIVVVSLVLPSDGHVEREGVVYAPQQVIFDQINDLRKMAKWNPWNRADTAAAMHFSVPAAGKGASYTWKSTNERVGEGKYTITDSRPDSLQRFLWYDRHLPPISGGFIIQPTTDGKGCWVKWYMDMPTGWKPWLRFYAVMMDKMIGPGIEVGLTNLRAVCEENAAQEDSAAVHP